MKQEFLSRQAVRLERPISRSENGWDLNRAFICRAWSSKRTFSSQKKSSPGFLEVTDPENKEGDASHNLIPSIPIVISFLLSGSSI